MVSVKLRPLYPRDKAPGTHWIGGWVGPRAGLNAVVKRKIPTSCYMEDNSEQQELVEDINVHKKSRITAKS
jgi:hypothetical protein